MDFKSATHGQCDDRPTITFPAVGHHWPVYYLVTEARVWTTCSVEQPIVNLVSKLIKSNYRNGRRNPRDTTWVTWPFWNFRFLSVCFELAKLDALITVRGSAIVTKSSSDQWRRAVPRASLASCVFTKHTSVPSAAVTFCLFRFT